MLHSNFCHVSRLNCRKSLLRVWNMQGKEWQEDDFSEFDETSESHKKKHAKQPKRKWREIEVIKERRREKRELASFDYSYMN